MQIIIALKKYGRLVVALDECLDSQQVVVFIVVVRIKKGYVLARGQLNAMISGIAPFVVLNVVVFDSGILVLLDDCFGVVSAAIIYDNAFKGGEALFQDRINGLW